MANPQWLVGVPWRGGWKRVAVAGRLTLGSDPGCDVVLRGVGIAARHVRLQVVGSRLEAVDLTGDGRTTLAGVPLRQRATALTAGDVLRAASLPLLILRASGTWVTLGDLGTRSPRMIDAFAALALAATTDWPVLLTGESGVGKELAARALHDRSARRDGPWLAVNCGVLSGEMAVAELFGAQKGAYTGAHESRKGAFERADGGTLFLDEIGELTPEAQAMLLRVLEVGEVQILGGPLRRVDVRVVCATHRDLPARVQAGQFRLDLLHRLDVAHVHLPALRERPEDILPLVAQFMDGLPLPAGAEAALRRHAWPGNVREVRNFARRLQLRAHFQPPRLADIRAILPPPVAPPALCVVPGGGSQRGAARRQVVAELLASEAQTSLAWRKSGLPRGTFFRYAKAVRQALAA